MRIVLVQISDGLIESYHACQSHALIESQVGFVRNTVGSCGINDGLVEGEDNIFSLFILFGKVLRHFLDIGVETYAQETFLGEYLFYKFFSVHNSTILFLSVFLHSRLRSGHLSCLVCRLRGIHSGHGWYNRYGGP